jgi:hypothetical protein
MNRRRALAALLTVALSLAFAPAGAAGKPARALLADTAPVGKGMALLDGRATGPFGLPRNFFEIRFRNRDGYTIVVIASRQTVTLSVLRRDGKTRPSLATYMAHGRVTPHSIQASFAERGRISLRFRPTGRELRASARAGCPVASHRIIADLGLFVGKLRFRGEEGYTSVDVHRAFGGDVDLAALVGCFRGHAPQPFVDGRGGAIAAASPEVETHPSPPGRTRSVLEASNGLALERVAFAAAARNGDQPHFSALQASSEGQLGILRLVTVAGPRSSFAVDDAFSHAVVVPPPPFSGRGVFAHGPGTEKSWSGPLAVSFLGAPHVPLTGSPFSVGLGQEFR